MQVRVATAVFLVCVCECVCVCVCVCVFVSNVSNLPHNYNDKVDITADYYHAG